MIKNILSNKYSLLFFILLAFLYNIIVHRNSFIVIIMFVILLYMFNLYDIQSKIENDDFKNQNEKINNYYSDVVKRNYDYNENDELNEEINEDLQRFIDNINIYPVIQKNVKDGKLNFLNNDAIIQSSELIFLLCSEFIIFFSESIYFSSKRGSLKNQTNFSIASFILCVLILIK